MASDTTAAASLIVSLSHKAAAAGAVIIVITAVAGTVAIAAAAETYFAEQSIQPHALLREVSILPSPSAQLVDRFDHFNRVLDRRLLQHAVAEVEDVTHSAGGLL